MPSRTCKSVSRAIKAAKQCLLSIYHFGSTLSILRRLRVIRRLAEMLVVSEVASG
jgi:hypothetical protein